MLSFTKELSAMATPSRSPLVWCSFLVTSCLLFFTAGLTISSRRWSLVRHADYDQYNFQTISAGAPSCSSISPSQVSFTLVTQLSINRLPLVEHHCQRWGSHPISLAVGGKISTKAVRKVLQSMGCDTSLISVSIIGDFKDDNDYPVNNLRNAAFAGVRTSHAVYLDADFWPSPNLYDSLMMHTTKLAQDDKMALVIPAFELHPICDADQIECRDIHTSLMPNNKDELMEIYASAPDGVVDMGNDAITQFNEKSNLNGHSSTRYIDWLKQDAYDLLPITCFKSESYEPYLAIRYCQDMPPFQEAFTGYGKNKITWIQQLRRAGYRFWQVGDSFSVHYPHKKSVAFESWKAVVTERGRRGLRVTQILASFQAWMADNVVDDTTIPLCDDDTKGIGVGPSWAKHEGWPSDSRVAGTSIPVEPTSVSMA